MEVYDRLCKNAQKGRGQYKPQKTAITFNKNNLKP